MRENSLIVLLVCSGGGVYVFFEEESPSGFWFRQSSNIEKDTRCAVRSRIPFDRVGARVFHALLW